MPRFSSDREADTEAAFMNFLCMCKTLQNPKWVKLLEENSYLIAKPCFTYWNVNVPSPMLCVKIISLGTVFLRQLLAWADLEQSEKLVTIVTRVFRLCSAGRELSLPVLHLLQAFLIYGVPPSHRPVPRSLVASRTLKVAVRAMVQREGNMIYSSHLWREGVGCS